MDHRRILNGILWIIRTGAPWRDLPERYGPWATVAGRFYRWRKAGLWARLWAAVQQQADAAGQLDWAHQHAAGAKKGAQTPQRSAAAKGASVPKSTCAPKAGANP